MLYLKLHRPLKVCRSVCTTVAPDSDVIEAIKKLSKSAQRRLGESINITGNTDLPYASRVGIVQRLVHSDGRATTLVYPKMLFRKQKLKLYNVEEGQVTYRDVCTKAMPRQFTLGIKSITDECVYGAEYYFEDGLRKVQPYFLLTDATMSERHQGQTLIQHIQEAFPFQNKRWIEYKIKKGYVRVNTNQVEPDQKLKVNDYVSNIIHFHEHPVLDKPIDIIYEDDEYLVVDKPPSYVLHAHASYRQNCLLFVLKVEFKYNDLRPIHRLDRLTSGVCILAKTSAAAKKAQKVFTSGVTEKEYLAAVDGEFPQGQVICDEPLSDFYLTSPEHKHIYDKPKESKTIFERIDYDGKKSVVKCIPITGRTHQIRIHLSKLGFHIINDSLYNPRDRRILMKAMNPRFYDEAMDRIEERDRLRATPDLQISPTLSETDWLNSLTKRLGKHDHCLTCEMGDDVFRNTFRHVHESMFMCLHAWRYRLEDKVFESKLPFWLTDKDVVDSVYAAREISVQNERSQ